MATSSFRSTASALTVTADKQPRKLWANIGLTLPSGEFVSLPLGVALDDAYMSKNLMKGDSSAAQLQRALLEALTQITTGLPAGESVVVPKLEIQLRHAAEATEKTASSDAMAAILAVLGMKLPQEPKPEPKPQDATSALMATLLGK